MSAYNWSLQTSKSEEKVRSENKTGGSGAKQTNTLEGRGGGRQPSESSEDDDDERRCTHGCMKVRDGDMVVGTG